MRSQNRSTLFPYTTLFRSMLNQEDFEVEEIRLYDNDTEKNHDMEIIMKYIIEKESYNVSLKRTEDPKEAFTGTDFVFSQIRVGKIEMREQDEKIPLKYGVVGQETCGLGGFSYGKIGRASCRER